MADAFSLPAAFVFVVGIAGSDDLASSFQEVSGLQSQLEMTTLEEGGENRFGHKLPGEVKASTLVAKRGIVLTDSDMMVWITSVMEADLSKPIEPKDLTVSLLDNDQNPVITWTLTRAWPVSWSVDSFGADQGKLAVQSIEFAYSSLERHTSLALPEATPEKP